LSSKAKQVLLWLMIISSALVFVWYLQTKSTTPPREIPFDAAMTQIRNKDIREIVVKQDTLELTSKSSDIRQVAKLFPYGRRYGQPYHTAEEPWCSQPKAVRGWPLAAAERVRETLVLDS